MRADLLTPARTTGAAVSHRDRRVRIVGIFFALCAVALFTSFVLVSKAGLRSALVPLDLLAVRYVVAGAVMLPVFMRFGLLGLSSRQALTLTLTGGLGFAAFAYSGFSLAPASHGSSLIHGTLPLTTLLISWICFGDRGSNARLYGASIITVGIALLLAESLGSIRAAQLLGDGYLLAASLCWSAYGLLARRFGVRAIPAAALVAVLSAIVFVPGYFLSGITMLFEADIREVIWQGLFQGLAISVLSLIVYTTALEKLGAETVALFAAATPAVTTLLSIPLLGEQPNYLTCLGVLFVTTGIIVSAYHRP